MHKAKFNKDTAGYMMLVLLAEADGDFDPREGNVIVDFIKEKFPLGGNFESAMDEISTLDRSEYGAKLTALAEDFYSESSEDERTEFLRFAVKLVKADDQLVDEENKLINRLFEAWDV